MCTYTISVKEALDFERKEAIDRKVMERLALDNRGYRAMLDLEKFARFSWTALISFGVSCYGLFARLSGDSRRNTLFKR